MRRRAQIALVTCDQFPDLHQDDQPLVPALAAIGHETVPAVWDDPRVDWDGFDLAVLRSTWDYVDRVTDFLAWAESVPRLANPADVVKWNVDKQYLAEVAAAGVPVIPTSFVAPGEDTPVLPPGEVVVKPAVSAGARETLRLADAEAAAAHLAAILASGRTAIVQPYFDAVDDAGETAVIFLGGRLSHAARKAALLQMGESQVNAGLFATETMATRQASAEEVAVATAALTAVPGGPGRLLYARVDLIPDADGRPTVIEVEVTEPSLFLDLGDGAVDRFAAAIDAALTAAQT